MLSQFGHFVGPPRVCRREDLPPLAVPNPPRYRRPALDVRAPLLPPAFGSSLFFVRSSQNRSPGRFCPNRRRVSTLHPRQSRSTHLPMCYPIRPTICSRHVTASKSPFPSAFDVEHMSISRRPGKSVLSFRIAVLIIASHFRISKYRPALSPYEVGIDTLFFLSVIPETRIFLSARPAALIL